MRCALILFCLGACGAPGPAPSAAPRTAPENVESAAHSDQAARNETTQAAAPQPDRPVTELCLPMVNGCGCSTLCARGTRHLDGQRYEVSHAGQDSRSDIGTLSRWCFTPGGFGTLMSEDSEEPDGSTCIDAFWVGACGGECIPTPIPRCGLLDGSCIAL